MIDEKRLIEAIIKDRTAFRSELYTDDSIRKYFIGIIEEQPKVGECIPCSERLPGESDYYMACIYNEEVNDFDFRKTWFAHVDDYDMEESEWRELYLFEKVTAWMPLPEPYQKE